MVMIPKNPVSTYNLLNLTDVTEEQGVRHYLGMSEIGADCTRHLQYSFRKVARQKISKRQQRLLDFGNMVEETLVEALESIGIKVYDRQIELLGFAGHAKGHIDGKCINVPESPKTEHLLELKTHNRKNFKSLLRFGVQKGYPTHYGQCQRYMDALGLKRTLYLGLNKDTSEIYVERLREDPAKQEYLRKREIEVITSSTLAPRIGKGDKTAVPCVYCSSRDICYGMDPVPRNCRTCINGDLHDDGIWKCDLHGHVLSMDEQVQGCKDWSVEEMFK